MTTRVEMRLRPPTEPRHRDDLLVNGVPTDGDAIEWRVDRGQPLTVAINGWVLDDCDVFVDGVLCASVRPRAKP